MRCPECSQRNSVAARTCVSCGKALPRKPLPVLAKIFLGSVVGLVFVLCLAAISTTMDSPEKALIRAAGAITGTSRSPEQAVNNFRCFDQAVQVLLRKFGHLSTAQLRQKLAQSLPKSLYEAHVFELLPDIKLVEIDTALNVADYLVLLRNDKAEITPVIGLHVYDSSSFLPQTVNKQEGGAPSTDGQMLVLLGHTAGANGHHPTVKVLFLSAGRGAEGIVDMTDSIVPNVYGEGSVKLAANQKDIDLALTVLSRGQDLKLFAAAQNKPMPLEDETLYDQLIWANNRYNLRSQSGNSKLYALYSALTTLQNHHKMWRHQAYFSPAARRFIAQSPVITSSEGFVIKHGAASPSKTKVATTGNAYTLIDDTNKIVAVLRYIPGSKKTTDPGGRWLVDSIAIYALPKPAKEIVSQPVTPPQPAVKIEQPQAPAIATTAPAKSEAIATAIPVTAVTEQIKAGFYPDITATVKLRSGPGTNFEIIAPLPPSTTIVVTGRSGSWFKVNAGGKEGFVYGGLVDTQGHQLAGCTSAKIKVSLPIKDENEHVIAYAQRGQHLIIVDSSGKKYKVILANGKSGYLDREAIDFAPVTVASSVAPPATSTSNLAAHSATRPRVHAHKHAETPPPLVP